MKLHNYTPETLSLLTNRRLTRVTMRMAQDPSVPVTLFNKARKEVRKRLREYSN